MVKATRLFSYGLCFSILIILSLVACIACSTPAAPATTVTVTATPAVQPEEQVAGATLVVTPVAGAPKEAVTYYGGGFAPFEKITLEVQTPGFKWNTAPKESMGIIEASEWGAFKFADTFPRAGMDAGIYTIVAKGDQGSIATSPWVYVEAAK